MLNALKTGVDIKFSLFVICIVFYNNILITLEIEKGNIWIEMNMKLNPSDIQVTIKGKGITLVKY
jgi:hypothetical protein